MQQNNNYKVKKWFKTQKIAETYMFQPSNLMMKTGEFIVQVHGINPQLDLFRCGTGSGAESISAIQHIHNSLHIHEFGGREIAIEI